MPLGGFLDILRAAAGTALRQLARWLLLPSKGALWLAGLIDPQGSRPPPGPGWREPPAAPPPEWDVRRAARLDDHDPASRPN